MNRVPFVRVVHLVLHRRHHPIRRRSALQLRRLRLTTLHDAADACVERAREEVGGVRGWEGAVDAREREHDQGRDDRDQSHEDGELVKFVDFWNVLAETDVGRFVY